MQQGGLAHKRITCRVALRRILMQARGARGMVRVRSRFTRGRDTETLKRKTRLGRRVCISGGGSRKLGRFATPSFLYLADFRKPFGVHWQSVPKISRFRAGAAHPGGPMLAFVPVTLDLYRTVRRHLHWTLQNLVSFANRTGKCWPSVRTLAAATGQPRSTVSRHLAQLAEEGVIMRQRRPGGVYAYVIASRFLPTMRGVSHQQDKGVPLARTEEQAGKKTGYAQARFAKPGLSFGEIPDETAKWEAR